jgi:integrase
MARSIHRLKELTVKAKRLKPGYHSDGGGLYLQVTKDNARSWLFRFQMGTPNTRWMGLGSLTSVSLAAARTEAAKCRELVQRGIDPIEARKAERQQRKLDAAKAVSFRDCAERYIASHEAGWKSTKHGDQWRSSLREYAYPTLGPLSVADVDTGLVVSVLEPIWTTKPETANRLRGRIEAILDYAKTLEYRSGENPARWRGHLSNTLPRRDKVRKVQHHPDLPYAKIGDFMAELRIKEGTAARGLEFLILTSCRTGEVIGAKWGEIDLDAAEWTIPAERMKHHREHRVPLSDAAMAVLSHVAEVRQSDYVFPGHRPQRPMSNMAFLALLRRMGRGDITAHGFRSTFRDWAAERTSFPAEVAEMALAHTVGDKTERAYQRGDLLAKRRALADAWANFVNKPSLSRSATVTPIRR